MLLLRALYFADAFVWHYNEISTMLLGTFPVLFLFTAGFIVSYLWRKFFLMFKHASHEITDYMYNL